MEPGLNVDILIIKVSLFQGFEISEVSRLGPRDSVLFIEVVLISGSPHLGVPLYIILHVSGHEGHSCSGEVQRISANSRCHPRERADHESPGWGQRSAGEFFNR